jgi:hypothetical protein
MVSFFEMMEHCPYNLILFIRKTDRSNPDRAFLFIDPKDDTISLVDEMTEGGIFSRARTPMRAPAQ